MTKDLSLPVEHVSDTAYMVAAYRLLESQRQDAHFHDDLAKTLLGEVAHTYLDQVKLVEFGSWMMAVRTCMIDRWIEDKVKDGVDLVVNLAAGLDTRPYRLASLPATLKWWEVDFAPIVNHKNKVLASVSPRCQLVRKVVDLCQPAARQGLFDQIRTQGGKVLVLTEGLLIYLEQPDVDAIAVGLHALPNVKWWVSEFSTPQFLDWAISQWRSAKDAGETKGAVPAPSKQVEFRFVPPNLRAYFAGHGWVVDEFREYAAESKTLNRPPPHAPGTDPKTTVAAVAGSGYGLLTKGSLN